MEKAVYLANIETNIRVRKDDNSRYPLTHRIKLSLFQKKLFVIVLFVRFNSI